MLIEFVRHSETPATEMEGEDDALGVARPVPPDRHLTVDPRYVSAIIEGPAVPGTGEPCPITVIRMSDGRGFLVKGSYRETLDRLQAGGGPDSTRH